MVKSFRVMYPGNLFPWGLCEDRFASLYPALFEIYKHEEKIIPDSEIEQYISVLFDAHGIEGRARDFHDAMWGVSRELPSIVVSAHDGVDQIISNFSILALNCGSSIETDLLISLDRFLVLIILQDSGTGALGIWDVQIKDWCFSAKEAGLCIDQIEYDPGRDQFRGTFAYHHAHTPIRGEGEFVIDRYRRFNTKTYRCVNWNTLHNRPSPEVIGKGSFFEFERLPGVLVQEKETM